MLRNEDILLTGLHDLWHAGLTAALKAHCKDCVCVTLTTANVCEETSAVQGPAQDRFAFAVHSRRLVVDGVVGGLPAEYDHVRQAHMFRLRVSRSTGH